MSAEPRERIAERTGSEHAAKGLKTVDIQQNNLQLIKVFRVNSAVISSDWFRLIVPSCSSHKWFRGGDYRCWNCTREISENVLIRRKMWTSYLEKWNTVVGAYFSERNRSFWKCVMVTVSRFLLFLLFFFLRLEPRLFCWLIQKTSKKLIDEVFIKPKNVKQQFKGSKCLKTREVEGLLFNRIRLLVNRIQYVIKRLKNSIKLYVYILCLFMYSTCTFFQIGLLWFYLSIHLSLHWSILSPTVKPNRFFALSDDT